MLPQAIRVLSQRALAA